MGKNKLSTFLGGAVISMAMVMFIPSTANACGCGHSHSHKGGNSHSHKARYNHGYNCDTQCTTYRQNADEYQDKYYRTYN